MKRFIFSILSVAVFFVGLGAIVDKVGARFKSDDKAVELIRQARLAIGGDQAIAGIRSMTISGKTSHTFTINGAQRSEQGDEEIAFQLPDKFMKTVKLGHADGLAGDNAMIERRDVLVFNQTDSQKVMVGGDDEAAGGKKIILRKMEGSDEIAKAVGDGRDGEYTTADGKKIVVRRIEGGDASGGEQKIVIRNGASGEPVKVEGGRGEVLERHLKAHEGMRQNELARTTLALLLSAPEGTDATYTFAGEGDVDGTPCNIVNADFTGSSVKLYLSKASSLPVMISYTGEKMPMMFHVRTKAPDGAEQPKDNVMFFRTEGGPAPETAEFQVRFSDYRGVGGVQLPYKWTTSVGGQPTETFDVTTYDLNPANIADKFQNQKVFVRKVKDGQ